MLPSAKRAQAGALAGSARNAKAASSGASTRGAPVWKCSQLATSGAPASGASSQNGAS